MILRIFVYAETFHLRPRRILFFFFFLFEISYAYNFFSFPFCGLLHKQRYLFVEQWARGPFRRIS